MKEFVLFFRNEALKVIDHCNIYPSTPNSRVKTTRDQTSVAAPLHSHKTFSQCDIRRLHLTNTICKDESAFPVYFPRPKALDRM